MARLKGPICGKGHKDDDDDDDDDDDIDSSAYTSYSI